MSDGLGLEALAAFGRGAVPEGLFLTVSGAHLYGFPSADSDVDLRGCHNLPLPRLLGLRPPVETAEVAGEVGGREVELVSHDAGKYLRLLCKHNGYVLEQVFSPLVVSGRAFLDRLRPLARRCVTRACHRHYRGFLQTKRLHVERERPVTAKSLLYAYRVVLTGTHLLRSGEVEASLPRLNELFRLPFLDELILRKQAREKAAVAGLDPAWHLEELARWEARLDEAFAASTLPDEPPWDEAERLLLELRLGD